jgi:hypothetical protein
MALSAVRLVAVSISVVGGLAAGAITAKLTEGWTWALASALSVMIIALIASQLWLTMPDGKVDKRVVASGTASVAARRSVAADIESEIAGQQTPGTTTGRQEVAATGAGSIAAGKDVRGRIRTRIFR